MTEITESVDKTEAFLTSGGDAFTLARPNPKCAAGQDSIIILRFAFPIG
jgi:hypothetical protein